MTGTFTRLFRITLAAGSAVVLAGCVASGGSAPRGSHPESLYFPIPDGWTPAHSAENANQRIVELVRDGETIDRWSQLMTIQSLRKDAIGQPIESFLAGLRQEMSKRCAGLAWNVIAAKEASVLYEWSIRDCAPDPDQHEIARVMYGKNSVFRLAFTIKTPALPAEKRDALILALSEARVIDEE